jgi:hypothetical protein
MRDDITLKVKNAGEITAEYQVIGDPRNAVERRARVYVERLDFHAHGRQHQGRSRTGTVVQAAGSCPWEADMPAGVWAGSDQRSRHAVGMPALQSGLFIEQISELLLGSGPRGRRFKSSRPDQLNPENSLQVALETGLFSCTSHVVRTSQTCYQVSGGFASVANPVASVLPRSYHPAVRR